METNGNKNPAKSSNKNYCDICNTKFTTKYNFNAHILTRKHKMETLGNAFAGKSQPHDYLFVKNTLPLPFSPVII